MIRQHPTFTFGGPGIQLDICSKTNGNCQCHYLHSYRITHREYDPNVRGFVDEWAYIYAKVLCIYII